MSNVPNMPSCAPQSVFVQKYEYVPCFFNTNVSSYVVPCNVAPCDRIASKPSGSKSSKPCGPSSTVARTVTLSPMARASAPVTSMRPLCSTTVRTFGPLDGVDDGGFVSSNAGTYVGSVVPLSTPGPEG